ncbi:hypothetical protein GCM10027076_15110 [Nocardioides montaniterrae]
MADHDSPWDTDTTAERFERLSRVAIDAAGTEAPLPGTTIRAVGIVDIRAVLQQLSAEASETLSVRSSVTAESLVLNHDTNVALAALGKRMTGLFDFATTEPAARAWLAAATSANYRYCHGAAGLQFKTFDRRLLVVPGPRIDSEPSLLAITVPEIVQSAMALFRKLMRSGFPVTSSEPPTEGFTPRQWRIAMLMANDLGDEAIAQRLGVSLRTVRSDIAALMRALGVQSRFAAGIRVSELGMVQEPWPASGIGVRRPSA